MSFETIKIIRQFPIINGFVQLPNNLEQNRSAVSLSDAITANPNANLKRMDSGVGGARTAGGKFGTQEWLEVCSNAIGDGDSYCEEAEDLKDLQ